MMLNRLSVSVVICTKNRHDDIVQCIDSLLEQTYAVNEIVVIDSSNDNGLEKILDKYISYSTIKYIYVDAILTKARNIGIDNSSSDLVMFLDDDTILDKFYVHNIVSIFSESHGTAIGGVSGKIIQEANPPVSGLRKSLSYCRTKLLKLFATIFFMFRYHDGIFRLSGVQTFVDYKVDKVTKTEGLSGANMTFLRDVVSKFKFDETMAYADDDDIAYRVSRKHQNYYVPEAKIVHNASPTGGVGYRPRRMQKEIEGYYHHFQKNIPNKTKHKLAFNVFLLGLFIRELAGLILLKKDSWKRLIGVVYGIHSIYFSHHHKMLSGWIL